MSTPPSVDGVVTGFASRLRFPYLLLFTATLFVADLLIPDFIPFFDEILLGLGTLILATLRTKAPRRGRRGDSPDPSENAGDGPVIDVPRSPER